MAMSYIKLYYDFRKTLKSMPDDAAGRLIKAIFDYVVDGNEPELQNGEQYVFLMLQSQLDRDKEAYEKTVARNQENGKNGGRPKKLETQENPLGFSETQENPQEPTKSQDKNKIKEDKTKNKTKTKEEDKELRDNISYICSETLVNKRSKQETKTPSEYNIPLNDGTEYNVPLEDIEKFKGLYPAVDVEAEIRRMIGWCYTNETKRKTIRGIKRFINGWLSKEQDRGGNYGANKPATGCSQSGRYSRQT